MNDKENSSVHNSHLFREPAQMTGSDEDPGRYKSLKAQGHRLADTQRQIKLLNHSVSDFALIPFQEKMENIDLYPLKPTRIEILQVNVGKMCNQTCKHCHVDAGPDRKEIMNSETMRHCLDVLSKYPSLKTIDVTGGAPELNPHFRWFIEEINKLNRQIIVRCNLTIILANKRFNDLPQFFKHHNIEVISSLPHYTQERTDRQRGNGVFEESIKALQMLNAVGYGIEGSGLVLNLVYNPAGAFLPPAQNALEKEYKDSLFRQYSITFNKLYTITNMPVSRYLHYLLVSGNYESYMEKLVNAFNPAAAAGVMCRNMISVGWDGYLYDCDFNQMLDLKIGSRKHLKDFDLGELNNRNILVNQHCYGCTAGAGSSCGGTTV